ncbi:MAG: type II secretion system F family protein [Bacteroidetes bacterium]|nr:type II secretion system F family protein [Bacteroidota bacterium]
MAIPIRTIPERPASAGAADPGRSAVRSFGVFKHRLDRGLDDVRKERLFRELALLLRSGVDPRTVLELLERGQREGPARTVIAVVRGEVVRGSSLSEAMAKASAFTAYERYSVRIGEESGRLSDVFEELADHHADRIAIRRMLRQAFAYPVFVLCITTAVIAFMMNVIVPMFAQVFARSGAELPAVTRAILRLSGLFRTGWPWLLLGVAAVVGGIVLLKRDDRFKGRLERVIWKIPVLGPLQRKTRLARFCRSMAFLLSSGAPLDRALQLSEHMSGSVRLERALERVREQVVRGASLGQALAQHPEFEPSMVAMVGVAEEVKQLDRMFLRLAERYTADVKHRTALLGSVLEPAMILLIAVLVGIVLVAMYLPMFKLSTTF